MLFYRYTLTLNMSLESGKPADRQGITELVCTTVAGASLLRTSGAETVRLLTHGPLQMPLKKGSAHSTAELHSRTMAPLIAVRTKTLVERGAMDSSVHAFRGNCR